MRKFLSAAIAVLMIVSMLPMSVSAVSPISFRMDNVTCAPGEIVSVPIYIEGTVKLNSIALNELTYDTSLLTFVGFENYGELVDDSLFGDGAFDQENSTIMLGYMKSFVPSGFICDAVFEVNPDIDESKTVSVSMTSLAKDGANVIESSFTAGQVKIMAAETETAPIPPVSGDPIILNIADVSCEAGERIYVEVTISGTEKANSFAAAELVYDTSLLTFVGFENYGSFVTKSFFGDSTMDEENQVICVGYQNPIIPDGKVCDLVFDVNPNAAKQMTSVSYKSFIVKNGPVEVASEAEAGFVTIAAASDHETVPPVTDAPIVLNMGNVSCGAGETIYVELAINSTQKANSFAISNLKYDANVLTFVGFANTGELYEDAMFQDLDVEKGVVGLGFMNAFLANGKACDVVFEVNPNAEGVTTTVSADFLAKNGATVIDTAVVPAQIEIGEKGETKPVETKPVEPEPDETEPDETEPAETEPVLAWFVMENWVANPGDVIDVGLYLTTEKKVNSIALNDLVYDTERFEFLGFVNTEDAADSAMFAVFDDEKGTIGLGYKSSKKFTDYKLCDLRFKIKEDAPYGKGEAYMTPVVKNNSTVYNADIDHAKVFIGSVEYTFGTAFAPVGGTVRIPLYINSTAPVNSLALSDLLYDTNAMTFVGFEGWENSEIIAKADLYQFDAEKGIIAFALNNAKVNKPSGYICDLVFEVSSYAEPGMYYVNMNGVSKIDSDEILTITNGSNVSLGSVVIQGDSGMALPGDTVDVPVYVGEISGNVNEFYLAPGAYDTERLEFLGFVWEGRLGESEAFHISKPFAEGDLICSLRFKVKDNAVGGVAEIPLDVKSCNTDGFEIYTEVVDSAIAVGLAEITVGNVTGDVGEKVLVPVTISTTAPITSIYLNNLYYDSNVFTFEGFDTAALDAMDGIEYGYTDDNNFTLLISGERLVSDVTFHLIFTIHEEAEDGLYNVGPVECLAQGRGGIPFITETNLEGVEVVSCLTGDINDDGQVNIQDALYLFLNSMLPEDYPMNYKKNTDYTGDGEVNIQDALYLFLYSMLPEDYPIVD